MIIVNQDKGTIINVKNIEAIGIGNPLEDNDGKFKILANTISDNQYTIGKYKTEERAKEVLQEIINYFSATKIENSSYQYADLLMKLKHIAVYEMPEE